MDGSSIIAAPSLAVGGTFTILDNAGSAAVSGTFANLPQGAEFFADSQWWRISYTGGTGNDVVLTRIAPTAWQNWQAVNFGTNANNSAIAGDFADFDRDGLVTRLEYAFGGNPNVASQTSRPRSITAGGKLAITFTRILANTDITMTVQASDSVSGPWIDLARSTAGGAFVIVTAGSVVTETGSGATRSVEVRDLYLITDPAHPMRFLRIGVTRP